jgi:cytochrome c peroxidase
MCRTRLFRSGPGLAMVDGAILAVVLTVARAAERPSGDVPRDEHGAASTEVQLQVLAKLVPGEDVSKPPADLDPVIVAAFTPEDNATTPERVELGRKLYFDKRLSDDGSVSCATCHDVTRGFTDQDPVSEGIGGQHGKRNAPTTLNVVLLQTLFWDGRSPTLDHQARQPILNPVEMGMADPASAVKAISDDPEYQKMFRKAYGRDMNYEDLGRAIGAFERTLVFVDSPFRRFLAGDKEAISADARAGFDLFNGKGRCMTCHSMNPSNPLGTDNRFHNVGVSARHQDFESLARQAIKLLQEDPSEKMLDQLAVGTDLSELGRFMVTRNRSDVGSFRTPLILNVGITPPYMHDGSMKTLWDVIDHYNKGGEPNPFLDGGIEALALEEKEIDQLVAFLFTLTDDRFADENQRQFERQREIARKDRPFRDEDMAFRRRLAFEQRVEGPPSTEKTEK